MKCPYCTVEFPLTWKRYAKAPFGKHTCPSCKKQSRLRYTTKYVLCAMLPIALFAGCLTFLFLHYSGGKDYTVLLAIGIALAVGLPLDRYCDDKFKNLKQIEGSDTA